MKYNSCPSLRQTGKSPPNSEICIFCAPATPLANGRTKTSKRPVSSDVYATHRPSGEKRTAPLRDLASRRRFIERSAIETICATLLPGSVLSVPVPPTAAQRPSRDQSVGELCMSSNCVSSELTSDALLT